MSFETSLMHPIGTLSFLFSVSQGVAWNLFQVTSDGTHMSQCNQALTTKYYHWRHCVYKTDQLARIIFMPLFLMPPLQSYLKTLLFLQSFSPFQRMRGKYIKGLVTLKHVGGIRCQWWNEFHVNFWTNANPKESVSMKKPETWFEWYSNPNPGFVPSLWWNRVVNALQTRDPRIISLTTQSLNDVEHSIRTPWIF